MLLKDNTNEALKALLWMHLLRLRIIKGLWFSNAEVNLAEGQYEQSIQDTNDGRVKPIFMKWELKTRSIMKCLRA